MLNNQLLTFFFLVLCSHRFLYNRSGEWSDGTVPILAATAAGFTYITFLMVSCNCSVAVMLHCGFVYENLSKTTSVLTISLRHVCTCHHLALL